MSPKFLFILLGVLWLLDPVAGKTRINSREYVAGLDSVSVTPNHPEKGFKSSGYRAIAGYGDGFIAAGSEGRIDWISDSGKLVKSEKYPGESFNCLTADNQQIVVAGDHGILRVSSNKGIFRKINSGTDKNINSIALFKGLIIAATDDGVILSGNGKGSFRKTYLAVNGNIVSLSSRASDCYGATDDGEIIHTTDGINWDVFDFNEVYAGFYKPCSFTSIIVTENRMAAAGMRNDGSPVLMFSSQGNVWTDRTLNYTDDQGNAHFPTEVPNNIYYDAERDLFFLAFNKGILMKIPSCSHCNKLVQVSAKNLQAISGNSNSLMIAGENFFIQPINPDWE